MQDVAQDIARFTNIPSSVLLNGVTESYCVAEKMKWISKRKTTRREDMAYCLLGLFDINMPLLYGEGEKVFERLQEEILKRSDDLSLFLWQDQDDSELVHRGLLARSPAEFSNFSFSWGSVNKVGSLPEHLDEKTWIAPKYPCTVTNLGIQLRVMLINDHDFYKSALKRFIRFNHIDGKLIRLNYDDWELDWNTFYGKEPTLKDDEYLFCVSNFVVGQSFIGFYILPKRLAEGGNQFARLRPSQILQTSRLEGHHNKLPSKLETVFIRQKLKILPSIAQPRIYGFSMGFMSSESPLWLPFTRGLTDVFKQLYPVGLMSKHDGKLFLPAVVSPNEIVARILADLIPADQPNITKTVCLVLKFEPKREHFYARAVLKIFEKEAVRELCSTPSYYNISSQLEEKRMANFGALGVRAIFDGYVLDKDRLVAKVSIISLNSMFRS